MRRHVFGVAVGQPGRGRLVVASGAAVFRLIVLGALRQIEVGNRHLSYTRRPIVSPSARRDCRRRRSPAPSR
jgi:hypothetical protein